MCKFMTTAELPTRSSGGNNGRNSFIDLYLKPNKEGERYRFRLLWYTQPSKNNRTQAYFCQKIHEHWGTTDKGNKVVDDFVICPGTYPTQKNSCYYQSQYDEQKFILNEKTQRKELNCPICQKANHNKAIWKLSNFKDKVSAQKMNTFKSKFRGFIPVYVVNDPNNEKNNGKLKCIVLTNEEEFLAFDKLVQDEKAKAYVASREGNGYEIFNGGNAVDFYMRMESVSEVRNAGKPNEYTSTVRKITQMAFGKKAYPIPSINKEAIDTFDFDDKHYTSSTKEEILAFYNKYYGQDEVTVPDEDVDVFSSDTKVSVSEKVEVKNESIEPQKNEDVNSELDDIIEDCENKLDTDTDISETSNESVPSDDVQPISQSDDEDINSLLKILT